MFKCTIILSLYIFMASMCYGQEISEERKAAIEKEISLAVDFAVQENVTPLILAEKYKMPFPPKLPVRSVAEVEAEVEKIVEKMVEEKFPSSEINRHTADAMKKYVLYKKGEEVTVRIRPTGRKAVVTGVFKGFNRAGQLLIGSYNVPKVDMTEDVMVHFDEELSKKKIARYIENKLFYFNEDRKTYKQEMKTIQFAKSLREAGYYRYKNKYIPADEFLKKSLAKARESYRNKMAEILTEVTFRKHGYLKKNGTWVNKKLEPISTDASSNKKVADKKPVSVEDKIKANDLPVRERKPLFEPSFYDTDF